MADPGVTRPTLPIADTFRNALIVAPPSMRSLGPATTFAFLVVLAKEAAHTLMADAAATVRFHEDIFLVDGICTILLAPYWMAMFRTIIGVDGSVQAIVTGRAGPFQDFLALELFWLLVSGVLDRVLSTDTFGSARVIPGLSAWIAILILQIWTSMLAPALAAGAPDANLRAVIAMTRGSAGRIGLILVAAILPLGFIDRMLHGPERAGADLSPFVLAIRILASALLEMAMLVLVTALLAEIYRWLRAPGRGVTLQP
ncbi:hypothetical protein [Methylobacterium sp. 37f]|uniref:hypothetical protein n=1 Tax=Methylobacterium sp. 37f TaxID=2817058 RepID=UPI001FFD06CC|nr:hypothetical protein [Methylobacterium sp. 37f]MCK2055964.1 hypothetical protein [Methylobacterium sp. 37f]